MGKLDDKVAIVTGGARGIGRAISRRLVKEGARVVVADVLREEGESLAAEFGEVARYVELDVRSEDGWATAVSRTIETFGQINVLVNNAGVLLTKPIIDMTLEEWDFVIGVNQTGAFLGMRAVIPSMTKAQGGAIVNTSSVDGIGGMPGMVGYVASKFALRGMTKVAALELGRLGIRVNSIHPGPIETGMIGRSENGAGVKSAFAEIIPLGRVGDPDEVARLVSFLVSDESSYCTGSEFVIDGGWIAGVPALNARGVG